MLDLRIIVVGGSCAKKRYRQQPAADTKMMLVPLMAGHERDL
jgi:hypothetical protein